MSSHRDNLFTARRDTRLILSEPNNHNPSIFKIGDMSIREDRNRSMWTSNGQVFLLDATITPDRQALASELEEGRYPRRRHRSTRRPHRGRHLRRDERSRGEHGYPSQARGEAPTDDPYRFFERRAVAHSVHRFRSRGFGQVRHAELLSGRHTVPKGVYKAYGALRSAEMLMIPSDSRKTTP